MVAMPFYIRHDLSFSEVSGGKMEITVGPQVTMGKAVSASVSFTQIPKN